MRQVAKPVLSALLCLTFLSACGGLAGRTKEGDPSEWLRTLDEAKHKGEVGSVAGFLALMLPGPPTPLRDWPVTLIPLMPTLEAAVTRSKEHFLKSGRLPLTAEAMRLARQPITDAVTTLQAMGHTDLIRTVKTETGMDPRFTFQDVPAGRWLLLAELPSKASLLWWAQPVTVTPGEQTWQSLTDNSLWLEGFMP